MKNIFKRLLFGIICFAVTATWFLWFIPFWIITNNDPLEGYVVFFALLGEKLLDKTNN